MPQGKELHEKKVKEFKEDLEKDGWRVILLDGKSPDGVAVKGDKICAVEVLGKRLKRIGKYKGKYKDQGKTKYAWRLDGYTFHAKRQIYRMFDDVLFSVFYREETDKRELSPAMKKMSKDNRMR